MPIQVIDDQFVIRKPTSKL